MKSLAHLLELLLHDLGEKCGVDVRRDIKTLRARVKDEGESYITITLAGYAKDLDQALDVGHAVPGSWGNFGRLRSGLPTFGSGFLHRVFDRRTGRLLPKPNGDCIDSLRQLSRFGVKILLECTQARTQNALSAWEELDKTLENAQDCSDRRDDDLSSGPERPASRWQAYQRVAAILIAGMTLEDEDGNIPVLCRHGPGATTEGYTPNGKWALSEWHDRLETAGLTYRLAHLGSEKSLWGEENVPVVPLYVRPEDEQPVRVVCVPKTLQAPRVIAVEPCCVQFAQQGLAAVLRTGIDQSPFTAGRINFRDQTVNQDLALLSSRNGVYSTIDLKDASDRVTVDLVEGLFEAAPERFREMLWACRSTRAKLPDGRIHPIVKFASMGSALCFPVEALVFYTLVVASRVWQRGVHPSPTTVAKLGEDVFVYGDDILAPSDETPAICDFLEAFGLRVNRRKSFWTGRFRESCGVDAYDGRNVTPTYLRHPAPAGRGDASAIVSWVATANALRRKGLCRTAGALQECVERLTGPLPEVPEDSPAIGWHGFSNHVPRRRWNRSLQRWEYRCLVAKPVAQVDELTSELGLLAKCLRRVKGSYVDQGEWQQKLRFTAPSLWAKTLDRDDEPEIPSDHLMQSSRPHALALKREWVAL